LLGNISSQYPLFLGISGLVLLLLFITFAGQKYQVYQYQRQLALRHMLTGIKQVENVLSLLEGCAVPVQLLVLLRKEILARYVTIRQIDKRFDNIGGLISLAQQEIQSAQSRTPLHRLVAADRATLERYIHGLSKLISFLDIEGHIAGMNEAERKEYQNTLVNLRADYIFEYYTKASVELADQELWDDAKRQTRTILQLLQTHGLVTDHVKHLYQQANQHLRQLVNRQAPGSTIDDLTATQA